MIKRTLAAIALALALATGPAATPTQATPAAPTELAAPAHGNVGAAVGVVLRHIDAAWPCAYFKPHTGDAPPWLHAWNNESNPYIDTADCAATHPSPPGDHLYCAVEWHHDGSGREIDPPAWTWQSGWC